MKWASAISELADADAALAAAGAAIDADLGGAPDLVFAFVSPHHHPAYAELPALLRSRWPGVRVFGCSGGGVIGAGRELEQRTALSLTAGRLPGVDIDSWWLDGDALAPGSEHSARLADLAMRHADSPRHLLVLADPFTFPAEQFLRSLDHAVAGGAVAGGLASGGANAGDHALFVDDECHRGGAVVLALGGDIEMLTAVAQGCRPIGQPMFVTACDGNKLSALDGRAAVAVINELYEQADTAEQNLMQQSLFIGLAMRERESEYHQGDFLVRNVAGADQDKQSIWVGAPLHNNQVVQFHLRDATTSAADLAACLDQLRQRLAGQSPAGALLFSCGGRGQGLYGHANHDCGAYLQRISAGPLGGFFCNGEIGPVGGTTFVHAYTSAFAVFTSSGDGAKRGAA